MEEKYKPEVFSEKPPLDNPNIPKISEIPGAVPSQVQSQPAKPGQKKKNRTLQFYKFLFYATKLEIKVHEFFNLLRFTNKSEILLWIISFILYLSTPKDFPKIVEGQTEIKYKNAFIWFHLLHIARAAIGIYIFVKIPRSFSVVEAMKGIPDDKLSKTLFNDLARDTMHIYAIKPIQEKKVWFYIYAGITGFNLVFDIIDFFVVIGSLNKATSDSKVVLITYLMIAFLYLICDFGYVFWTMELKYTMPPAYIAPISDAFTGTMARVMQRFKIGKAHTDVAKESGHQGANSNNNNINNQPIGNLPMMKDQIVNVNLNANSTPMGNNGQNNKSGIDDNDVRIDL